MKVPRAEGRRVKSVCGIKWGRWYPVGDQERDQQLMAQDLIEHPEETVREMMRLLNGQVITDEDEHGRRYEFRLAR